LRRRDAKAKRFASDLSSATSQKFADREQGPVPPKRAGAHALLDPSLSSERAQSYAGNHFNSLAALSRHFSASCRLAQKLRSKADLESVLSDFNGLPRHFRVAEPLAC
jgi:hypothetical protein